MPEIRYKRLTRTPTLPNFDASFLTTSSLWLGPDHLLCVTTTGFTEQYKRLFYRDIQSVTLRKTRRQLIWSWLMLIPCLAFVALAVTAGDPGFTTFFAVVAGLFALGIFLNLLVGPSTLGYVRTAVQTEVIPSLSRLGRAHRALDRLRPLIEAAQGTLPPEEFAHQLALLQSESTSASPTTASASSPVETTPPATA